MVVYADILIVLNLTVNFLLLSFSAKILRLKPKPLRLFLSAFLGAVSSLYIFLPKPSIISELSFKISVCLVMTLIAFKFSGFKQFLRQSLILFAVTCGYGGLMIALWHIFRPDGMIINNSVVYFNISPTVLVGTSVAAYLIITLLRRIFTRNSDFAGQYEIKVSALGNTVTLKAFADTGNSVTDIFGQSEIIITDRSSVNRLFGTTEIGDTPHLSTRLRMIPCSTVSGEGLLKGFRCDSAVLQAENKVITLKNPILAISETPLRDGCNAILNPQILEQAGL